MVHRFESRRDLVRVSFFQPGKVVYKLIKIFLNLAHPCSLELAVFKISLKLGAEILSRLSHQVPIVKKLSYSFKPQRDQDADG